MLQETLAERKDWMNALEIIKVIIMWVQIIIQLVNVHSLRTTKSFFTKVVILTPKSVRCCFCKSFFILSAI